MPDAAIKVRELEVFGMTSKTSMLGSMQTGSELMVTRYWE